MRQKVGRYLGERSLSDNLAQAIKVQAAASAALQVKQ